MTEEERDEQVEELISQWEQLIDEANDIREEVKKLKAITF